MRSCQVCQAIRRDRYKCAAGTTSSMNEFPVDPRLQTKKIQEPGTSGWSDEEDRGSTESFSDSDQSTSNASIDPHPREDLTNLVGEERKHEISHQVLVTRTFLGSLRFRRQCRTHGFKSLSEHRAGWIAYIYRARRTIGMWRSYIEAELGGVRDATPALGIGYTTRTTAETEKLPFENKGATSTTRAPEWRTCLKCGVFKMFEDRTDECCINRGERCNFGYPEDEIH